MVLETYERHNWRSWSYLDVSSGRHSDPYEVLVLEPIDPKKTAPTFDDIFMFVEKLLETEKHNDANLQRPLQLPTKIQKIKNIIQKATENDPNLNHSIQTTVR